MTVAETLICKHCGETKPLDQFRPGRTTRKDPATCLACAKARKAAWHQANRERQLDLMREWKKANQDRYRTINRSYEEANVETVAAYRKQYKDRYWREHRDLWRDYAQQRRARERNAAVVEKVNRKRVIERDQSICWLCGEYVPPNEMSLDHVIPLAKGGHHTEANLRVAHMRCNSAKGVRIIA